MNANRKIAKNTAFLYLRMLVVMGTSLYTVRVVLDALGVVDFGVYGVAAGLVALLAFLNGTMSQAAQRFLAIEMGTNSSDSLAKVFNATLLVHAGIALIVIIAAETVGLWILNTKLAIPPERMAGANFVYHCSVAVSAILIAQTPFNALIVAREEMWFFSLVSLVESILKLAVAYAVSHYAGDRLELYAALFLGASGLIAATYACFCLKRAPEARINIHFSKNIYYSLAQFTGWSFIGNLSSAFRNQGSNLLLNVFFGVAANASHGVMTQAQTAATSFLNSFQMAISPQIYKSYARQDIGRMHALIFTGAKLNFALLSLIVVPALHCMDYLLILWLKNPPQHAAAFIKLMLIMLLSESISQPLMTAAAATGRIKWYQIIVGGTILLNIPISYLAYQHGAGPTAFLYVAIAITVVTLAQRLLFLKRMINMSLSSFLRAVIVPATIISTAAACVLYAAQFWLSNPDSTLECITHSAALSALTAVLCITFGLDRDERKALTKKATNICAARFLGRGKDKDRRAR